MPDPFLLTEEQLDAFDRRGVLDLRGFYPRAVVDQMAHRLWADLEQRFAMVRDRPETWTVTIPAQFKALVRSGAFDALGSPEMLGLADALLGAGGWDAPQGWGHPLLTFPSGRSNARRPPWHLDIGSVRYLRPLPVLRAFTFLAPVPPAGGGTLYVAGSHRLALAMEDAKASAHADSGRIMRSRDVRERLKAEHPWLARLLSATEGQARELLGVDVRVGGHDLRFEEMTGSEGDLILMHPAVLHASSHNALDQPRMMLTVWVYRHGAYTP